MTAEATIKAAEVLPVLESVTALLDEAVKANEQYQAKIAQQDQELAKLRQEKVVLEKVASTPKFAFSTEAVKNTMDSLVGMNIMDEELATKHASEIATDPNAVLPLMVKISEALITTPPGEGFGIEKEAASASDSDSDPDGWNAFATGRPVRLKP